MPHARITEFYPSVTPDGQGAIICRTATAPRDLASSILLWTYCCFAVAQVALAIASAVIAGAYLRPNRVCLLEAQPYDHPDEQEACYLTYAACGLTLSICAAVVALELLPERLVPVGVRNVVPLVLLILGTIVWGVDAATLHSNREARIEAVSAFVEHWHNVSVALSWSNMALFLTAATIKLFSPSISSCIDSTSIRLGRLGPDGCMPACDAFCCLDVATAKVPREVLRQGRVDVRFMSWNQENVPAAATAIAPSWARMHQ